MTSNKPVLGIIGGIGSGKSLVAKLLAERGGRVVAGDQLGHAVLREPAIRDQVGRRWPQVLGLDGEVDRKQLGAVVFANAAERRALEALVHPEIERRIREEISAAQGDPGVAFVVLDAAILLEAGWDRNCDRILYVEVPREVRLERMLAQRGWSEREVEAREQAQLSAEVKRQRADAVLDNAGVPAATAAQMDRLLNAWGYRNGALPNAWPL